jgi:ferrous iron transport protein A
MHVDGDTLLTLRTGEKARIVEILGGPQLEARLANMGLRVGKQVTKVGAMLAGGPVTVECDGFRVALGRGIAGRVRVERLHTPSAAAGPDE